MKCARTVIGLLFACALVWAPMRLAARQPEAPAEPPPTAIEEAIIEHSCGAMHPAGSVETTGYLECRQGQLLSLRNDFGRDLRRLSPAQRRTIDAACSGLRMSQGQDAYVACLSARLAALRPRVSGKTDASSATPESSAVPADAQPPVVPAAVHASRWWIAAVILVVVVAAAGGAVVVLRARRAPGVCRTCGVKLVEQGELCQKCRHEAAEVRRRASAERAEEERSREEEQRRQAAREQEQRQQRADEEEGRRRMVEAAEQAQAQHVDDVRPAHDEAIQPPLEPDAVAVEAEFDPHAVLGLSAGASLAEVEASYQVARAKYDLDLVADLGAELQHHFQAKRELVERAYETLVKIAER